MPAAGAMAWWANRYSRSKALGAGALGQPAAGLAGKQHAHAMAGQAARFFQCAVLLAAPAFGRLGVQHHQLSHVAAP
jgi:hypothetical protein